MYKLPERRGGGGGEGIWAMPERKHLFLKEVFPKHNPLNTATASAVGIAARVRVVFEKHLKNPGYCKTPLFDISESCNLNGIYILDF